MLLLAHNLDVDSENDSGEEDEPGGAGEEAGGRAAGATMRGARGARSRDHGSSGARQSNTAEGRGGAITAGFAMLEDDSVLREEAEQVSHRHQHYHYAGEDEGEEEEGETTACTSTMCLSSCWRSDVCQSNPGSMPSRLSPVADGANTNPWALLPREVALESNDDTGHAGTCGQLSRHVHHATIDLCRLLYIAIQSDEAALKRTSKQGRFAQGLLSSGTSH
jgi:hypothetical protein